MPKQVIKRDGRIVQFDPKKIHTAILKAMEAVSLVDDKLAKDIADKVVEEVNGKNQISVEEIQDIVENNLIKYAQPKVIKEYILYRAQRANAREATKSVIGTEDELKLPVNAISLLDGRYLKIGTDGKKETPAQMLKRSAKTMAAVEKRYGGSASAWQKVFYNMMANQIFFPNMPCLSNASIKDMNYLMACYVLSVDDSMDSIFSVAKDSAMIMKSGGGIGLNFSNLRPRNDIVKTTGKTSSGVVGFLPVYNAVVESVKQGGMRRGAALGLLRIDHPDILEYIACKEKEGTFSNFNLSVAITDKFMTCVARDSDIPLINPRNGEKKDSIRARYLLNLIAQNMWQSGDPGIVFFDNCQKNNPTPSLGPTYKNACVSGDTLIATADGRGTVSIKQLAEEGKDVPVYCKDNRGYTHIRMAFGIRKTGDNRKVFLVTLDDGSTLKTTGDHKFYLKDGSRVECEDLKPGMSLMRFDRYQFSYKGRKSNYWGIQKANRNVFQEHRMIEEFILGRHLDSKEIVHHKDFNGLNNIPSNLVPTRNHKEEFHNIAGENNPIVKMKKNGTFEAYKARNPFYNTNGVNNARFGVKLSAEQIEKQRVSLKARYDEGLIPANKGKTKNDYAPLMAVSKKLAGKPKSAEHKQHCKEAALKRHAIYNHKVLSIEGCGYEDVYNMTVNEFHNYCIVTSNGAKKQSGVTLSNCGETDLLPHEGCCLGSLNLTKFFSEDKIWWDALSKAIYNAVHFLDDVIDASDYILPKIKEMSYANRKIGLGVMGFADLLYMMKIPYNSDKAVEMADKLMEFIYLQTKKASEQLAAERGAFPNYNISIYATPIRNASFTVIAPTGEISILANCSPGIEPNYGLVFKRQTTLSVKELVTVNPVLDFIARKEGFYSTELLEKIIANNGSAKGIKEIPEEWQKIFVIAHEVSSEFHLKIQSAFQHHCDNSVSKTINLPNSATVSDVEKIIKTAYDLGCNGLTVFRDGCRKTQVMNVGENTCPECKTALVFSEGCFHCPSCGWGKCNI